MKFCKYCGAPVETSEVNRYADDKKCKVCGAIIMPGTFFCTQCGASVSDNVPYIDSNRMEENVDRKPKHGGLKKAMVALGIVVVVLLVGIIAFLLASQKGLIDSENTEETQADSDKEGEEEILPAGSEEDSEQDIESEKKAEMEEVETTAAETVLFEGKINEDNEEYATLTGIDNMGNTVWTYETEGYVQTELEAVSEIGIQDHMYYFVEGGKIVALDVQDGSVLWENDEFGGESVCFDFGDDGTLYLCGYYGPDFFAVDTAGNTLAKIIHFDDNFYGACKIEYLGDEVAVSMSEEEVRVFHVNLQDFSYEDSTMESQDDLDLLGSQSDLDSSEWKQAYIDYIESGMESGIVNEASIYQLVYVNDDEIPELLINYGSVAGGGDLCTFDGEAIQTVHLYDYGFSYMEKENMFCDSGGRMDGYYDAIYCIENGKIVELHRGDYGAEDNSHVQMDENGEPIYLYYWDDKEVSKSEYQERLLSVYDSSDTVSPYDNAYDFNEILGVIEDY